MNKEEWHEQPNQKMNGKTLYCSDSRAEWLDDSLKAQIIREAITERELYISAQSSYWLVEKFHKGKPQCQSCASFNVEVYDIPDFPSKEGHHCRSCGWNDHYDKKVL